jgi:hypothetical protein
VTFEHKGCDGRVIALVTLERLLAGVTLLVTLQTCAMAESVAAEVARKLKYKQVVVNIIILKFCCIITVIIVIEMKASRRQHNNLKSLLHS